MKLKKRHPKDLGFILGLGGTSKGLGNFLGLGVLTLQNMKDTAAIGSPVDKSKLIPGTATVYFVNEEAVSTLIVELTVLRKKMKDGLKSVKWDAKGQGITIDVSDNKPVANSNKRRQVSRKGKKR